MYLQQGLTKLRTLKLGQVGNSFGIMSAQGQMALGRGLTGAGLAHLSGMQITGTHTGLLLQLEFQHLFSV